MNFYETLFNKKQNNSEFGESRFMNWSEKRKFFKTNARDGYLLDGKLSLLKKHLPTHCITIAPTGAGKSVVLIGQLLNLTAKDKISCLVVDPSGEIRKTTEGWLKKQGYMIKSLNLNDINQSEQFNPLERAIKRENGIQETAVLLIEGKEDFWILSARSITELIIEALLSSQEEFPKNLASVLKIIHLLTIKPNEIHKFMATYLSEDKYLAYASFLSTEPKVRSSVLATVKASLSKLNSHTLQYITEKDTINFETLRREKTIIFISAREDKVKKYFGFILNLFITQLLEYALDMPENDDLDLHFYLDEFATFNLGEKSFPEILPILRRRRTACFMYLQDAFSQLEQNYGKSGARIILANSLNKIIFGKTSVETSKYVESLLGTTTKEINGNLRAMPLLSAQEIRGKKQWEFLYINGGDFNKMKVKPWFKSHLRHRANL